MLFLLFRLYSLVVTGQPIEYDDDYVYFGRVIASDLDDTRDTQVMFYTSVCLSVLLSVC